jgi:uncharacterized protein (DUF736 family)
MDKIGSLWAKTSKDGKEFFSGQLQLQGRQGPKIQILVFENDKQGKEARPDYQIYKVDNQPKSGGYGASRQQDDDDTPF